MAWNYEKDSGDLVFNGFEKGIAPSPHEGIANIINANTSTEMGEAMCSFQRTQQTQTATISGATFTATGGNNLGISGTSNYLFAGSWVSIGSGLGISSGTYYVLSNSGIPVGAVGTNGSVKISASYMGTQQVITSGSTTFTSVNMMSIPVQGATETYFSSNIKQYRYYVLDNLGQVWVNDTGNPLTGGTWGLIDTNTGIAPNHNAGGIAIYNGFVHVFVDSTIWVKQTSLLAATWLEMAAPQNVLNTPYASPNSHFSYVDHSNTLNICDSSYIATIFSEAGTNIGNLVANVWSYGTVTFSSSTFTITGLVGTSYPVEDSSITFQSSGTLPTGITAGNTYFIINLNTSNIKAGTVTFKITSVYQNPSDVITPSGGSGTLYYNTYSPYWTAGSGSPTFVYSPQAFTLPTNEIAQAICESGTQLIIGCQSNILYQLTLGSALATSFVPLPENNTTFLLNVNNMAYAFTGNKGNIYVSNGSTASGVLSIPDYTAGIPGNPTSYIEPYFIWGGAAYLRGRIYCSLQDQTASKTGLCGGIWSFVPTQAMYIQQDQGAGLRMENVNSYASFSSGVYTNNGMATVLLISQTQNAIAPQYFSAWQSAYTAGTYGIDGTGTTPSSTQPAVIETDAIPTGTFLKKKTFEHIEWKVSSPLLSSESIAINYRLNPTDAWTAFTGPFVESNLLSGYYTPSGTFDFTQWTQFQIILNGKTSSPSFNRLFELRLK